jgi:hypothetical protein
MTICKRLKGHTQVVNLRQLEVLLVEKELHGKLC